MKIDSHVHFWKYHPVKEAWITDDMKVIQRDFLPEDVAPILKANAVDGCIAVQADQSENETHFLLQLAEEFDFIKGVVGWIDFKAPNLEERLDYFCQFKKLKGFRHIVEAESDSKFLLNTDFCNGIGKLSKSNYTYDILVSPSQLKTVATFVEKFPKQAFVIDHLAKPNIKNADFLVWENEIKKIATCPNVYCKVSGLVTQADWNHWKKSDFTYCLDIITSAFGIERLLFGSDWPVCLLAASYSDATAIVSEYYDRFSPKQQQAFWSDNAISFYNLF
ncbi:amidohydrolase family protein [Flavobacterium sp.]|uniref:amidohydrolase family protein n=1 Tax=Flavobacterium sp. TaxID=239 RepID=UPI002C3407E0|nr:amidohydrolase family protein [Flavobacterium sp.]HSD08905.1 amidohydrolase family protein [Flavobacterium sp.]